MITQQSPKTAYRKSKERRDMAIYRRYEELIKRPGAMASAVDAIIMEEFTIHSPATVWATRKRVANKIARGEM